jgi:hypothetical protein
MCAWVGNQRSRGVVTARVRTDAVRSVRHQRRDLHQLTYPIPLKRSGLILLSRPVQPSPILCTRSPTPATILVTARHAAPATCTARDKQT